MTELIVMGIIFGGIGFWIWRYSKKHPELYPEKSDFETTKEEHGWFHYVWNWKDYAFKVILVRLFFGAWYYDGIGPAIGVTIMILIYKKIKDFFD